MLPKRPPDGLHIDVDTPGWNIGLPDADVKADSKADKADRGDRSGGGRQGKWMHSPGLSSPTRDPRYPRVVASPKKQLDKARRSPGSPPPRPRTAHPRFRSHSAHSVASPSGGGGKSPSNHGGGGGGGGHSSPPPPSRPLRPRTAVGRVRTPSADGPGPGFPGTPGTPPGGGRQRPLSAVARYGDPPIPGATPGRGYGGVRAEESASSL
eukprot:519609-Prorocentrum_minimum.AAC.1